MTMRIDLHTHSSRSDGTDSPAELVTKAHVAGLDVVALTDHDTTDGWDEAREAASDVGIRFVPGIEISTVYRGRSVHLLGYAFDAADPALTAELARVRGGRDDRLPRLVKRLNDLGYPLTVADVERQSPDATATGRPHVADALVELGYVADRGEAFDRLLADGRPAYIERYSADLFTAVALLRDAGGRSVVAHPWSRTSVEVLGAEVFERLKEAGLNGIEVDHQDHDAQARDALRSIAVDLDLVYTGSSDYHGTGKVDHPLGVNTTEPEQFERLFADRPGP